MARVLGFTRARVTQIMDLLLFATDIQEEILFLEVVPPRAADQRALRDGVLKSLDWLARRRRWAELRRAWSTVST